MSTPDDHGSRPRAGVAAVIGRVLAGAVALTAGVVFLATAWLALASRFGLDDRDVHGYGLIIGCILAVVAALIVALTVPLVLPRRLRGRALAIGTSSFMVVTLLLIAAVVTA